MTIFDQVSIPDVLLIPSTSEWSIFSFQEGAEATVTDAVDITYTEGQDRLRIRWSRSAEMIMIESVISDEARSYATRISYESMGAELAVGLAELEGQYVTYDDYETLPVDEVKD